MISTCPFLLSGEFERNFSASTTKPDVSGSHGEKKLAEQPSHDPRVVLSGSSLTSKSHFLLKTVKFLRSNLPQLQICWLGWTAKTSSNISYNSFTRHCNCCLCWRKKRVSFPLYCFGLWFQKYQWRIYYSHIFCCVNKPLMIHPYWSLHCVLKWPWAERYQMNTFWNCKIMLFFFLIDSFGSGTHDQNPNVAMVTHFFLLLFISVIVDIKSIFKVHSFKTKNKTYFYYCTV